MIVHILEKDTEVGLISYCKKHNLDFMDCCLRYCSGETFEEILGLPSDKIKLIHFGKEEVEND